MITCKAIFDFRCPQDSPDEDSYQYELEGFVDFDLDQRTMTLRVDDGSDQFAYKIIGIENNYQGWGGLDQKTITKAGWSQISSHVYIGIWYEDNTEYLFKIKIGKQLNK